MAWEGSWTPAQTLVAYQAEMGAVWERPARELALAKAPPWPQQKHLCPIKPHYQGVLPPPRTPPASFAGGNRQALGGLAGPGCAGLGPVASDLRALIAMGLGSLVGRRACTRSTAVVKMPKDASCVWKVEG